VVVDWDLAGGGDGSMFMLSGNLASGAAGGALDEDNLVGCYMGSTAQELLRAKEACIAAMIAIPPPEEQTLEIIDELLAGSSQGTVYMGLIVGLYHGGGG